MPVKPMAAKKAARGKPRLVALTGAPYFRKLAGANHRWFWVPIKGRWSYMDRSHSIDPTRGTWGGIPFTGITPLADRFLPARTLLVTDVSGPGTVYKTVKRRGLFYAAKPNQEIVSVSWGLDGYWFKALMTRRGTYWHGHIIQWFREHGVEPQRGFDETRPSRNAQLIYSTRTGKLLAIDSQPRVFRMRLHTLPGVELPGARPVMDG
jgi:hypothetical protein